MRKMHLYKTFWRDLFVIIFLVVLLLALNGFRVPVFKIFR